MIVKMNKLTLLVYHKEYVAFLQRLRDAGVVHVVEKNSGAVENPELEKQLALAAKYSRMIKKFEILANDGLAPAADVAQAATIVERAEALVASTERRNVELQVIDKDIAALEPWGEFQHSKIDTLRKAGYDIRFFITGTRNYNSEWEQLYNSMIIEQRQSRVYFVTVTRCGEEFELDAEQAKLPNASLSALIAERELALKHIEENDIALVALAKEGLNTLRLALEKLQHEIEFAKVVLNGEKVSGDKLLMLEGWVPADCLEQAKAMLDESGAFYELRDARPGDNPPVKLKNNAFARMYEVLTKMYGMPSGTDFDPTPIVAPFFSLFFAFCMGDAGYGLILVLLGFLLKKKLSKDLAGMMNLVITLGIFTTVIGAVLGTFFGMSLLDSDIPQNLKNFIISGNVELFGSTYDKQMILALLIGIVHISLAMTVKAINNTIFFGFKASLSTWGWWLVVVGGVVIGALSLLSVIPAAMSKWAFIAVGGLGALGIYVLNDLRRNVLVNIGAGLWDTYNMASGLLGDILSYIRLFALGLAGGMLGQTFNNLALMVVEGQDGIGEFFGWIGFGLIILIGHTLNIAMSCLSAFVHPLRLTFVEYFKNAGYDGKGVEYKPFKNE